MKRVTGIATWCYICRQYMTEGIEVNDITHFDVICDKCAKQIADIVNKEEYEKAPYKCDKCGKAFANKGLYLAHFRNNCAKESTIKDGTSEKEGD